MTVFVDSVMSLVSPVHDVVVCGSHGGLLVAQRLLECGVTAAIFNDAGVGRDAAGIAGLEPLEAAGVPAATVACSSARIGDAADSFLRGVISHANAPALAALVVPGTACSVAVRHLLAVVPKRPPSWNGEAVRPAERILLRRGRINVWGLDSASLVEPADAGQVLITGSHGGAPGGKSATALKADAYAAVFNDAGGGADDAGLSRLGLLDERKIAAATVSHLSARIGDARSTWHDGVVSYVNDTAARRGAEAGMTTQAFVDMLLARLVG